MTTHCQSHPVPFQHATNQEELTMLGDIDEPQPCGEGHCRCYGQGSEHADCACGCDCPRDDDGQLIDD